MKVWQLLLIVLIAAISVVLYVTSIQGVMHKIDHVEEMPKTNVTLLEMGTSDKQITVDATEIQGGHYFSR